MTAISVVGCRVDQQSVIHQSSVIRCWWMGEFVAQRLCGATRQLFSSVSRKNLLKPIINIYFGGIGEMSIKNSHA